MNQSAFTTETRYADAPSPVGVPSLLDAVLAATGEAPASERTPAPAAAGRLNRFLRETGVGEALREWFGEIPAAWGSDLRGKLTRGLNRDVARVDELLNAQLNAILH